MQREKNYYILWVLKALSGLVIKWLTRDNGYYIIKPFDMSMYDIWLFPFIFFSDN